MNLSLDGLEMVVNTDKMIMASTQFAQKLQTIFSLVQSQKDFITPNPEFGFPGLKDGDGWCVCASWYAKALEESITCHIYLKKTNIKTLEIIPINKLKKFAVDVS